MSPLLPRNGPGSVLPSAKSSFSDSRTLVEPVPVRISLFLPPVLLTTLPGRKTEEGWNVYKEDELGITAHGGGKLNLLPSFSLCYTFGPDTPLCPFDCQCCASPSSISIYYIVLIHSRFLITKIHDYLWSLEHPGIFEAFCVSFTPGRSISCQKQSHIPLEGMSLSRSLHVQLYGYMCRLVIVLIVVIYKISFLHLITKRIALFLLHLKYLFLSFLLRPFLFLPLLGQVCLTTDYLFRVFA